MSKEKDITIQNKDKENVCANNSDMIQEYSSKYAKNTKINQSLWYLFGVSCLIFGSIGLFFPILPTTPFLLLAAAAFFKSSPRAYIWLTENKIFGEMIRNYRAGNGISVRVKAVTIALLWITILISISIITIIWVDILLILIALIVSVHVLSLKPRKITERMED